MGERRPGYGGGEKLFLKWSGLLVEARSRGRAKGYGGGEKLQSDVLVICVLLSHLPPTHSLSKNPPRQ